ncbi:MAG: hypothetical protein AAFR61_31225, partial [Bacteroidota bacterium]
LNQAGISVASPEHAIEAVPFMERLSVEELDALNGGKGRCKNNGCTIQGSSDDINALDCKNRQCQIVIQ